MLFSPFMRKKPPKSNLLYLISTSGPPGVLSHFFFSSFVPKARHHSPIITRSFQEKCLPPLPVPSRKHHPKAHAVPTPASHRLIAQTSPRSTPMYRTPTTSAVAVTNSWASFAALPATINRRMEMGMTKTSGTSMSQSSGGQEGKTAFCNL